MDSSGTVVRALVGAATAAVTRAAEISSMACRLVRVVAVGGTAALHGCSFGSVGQVASLPQLQAARNLPYWRQFLVEAAIGQLGGKVGTLKWMGQRRQFSVLRGGVPVVGSMDVVTHVLDDMLPVWRSHGCAARAGYEQDIHPCDLSVQSDSVTQLASTRCIAHFSRQPSAAASMPPRHACGYSWRGISYLKSSGPGDPTS